MKRQRKTLLSMLILVKNSTFKELREETKPNFKITQKQVFKTKIERTIVYKTKECLVREKIIQLGSSDMTRRLHLNDHSHLSTCKSVPDVFKTPEMRNLLKGKLKPNQLIKQFNKDNNEKIPNNDETRRKISQLKYTEKQKNSITQDVSNLKDLQTWIESRYQANVVDESFRSLDWNQVFISDYEINGTNFDSFAPTKNLIYNIVKQNISGVAQLCADGTYKLNNLGYLTIVIGTVDLRKKFHLIGFGFCNTENEFNYEKCFLSFYKILQKIFPEFHLNNRISFMCDDGAIYIRRAAKKVLPAASIQLCRFHFWQTQEGKFKNKLLVPNLFSKKNQSQQKILKILVC